MSHNDIFVFLDFDGVTHPLRGVEDFRCLPLIEQVCREFLELRIVITSDWRTLYSLPRLAARFSEDLRPRVIGCTPLILPRRGASFYGIREREARAWLEKHASDNARWFAIDDAPGNWPTRKRLLLTDFKQGFTDEDADRMRALVRAIREDVWEADAPANGHTFWPQLVLGGTSA
jgi:hypothetical protein